MQYKYCERELYQFTRISIRNTTQRFAARERRSMFFIKFDARPIQCALHAETVVCVCERDLSDSCRNLVLEMKI